MCLLTNRNFRRCIIIITPIIHELVQEKQAIQRFRFSKNHYFPLILAGHSAFIRLKIAA